MPSILNETSCENCQEKTINSVLSMLSERGLVKNNILEDIMNDYVKNKRITAPALVRKDNKYRFERKINV